MEQDETSLRGRGLEDKAGIPAPPEREPVVLHVHRQLRLAILHGRLKPDERLVETQLSARMSVSRTPIREAISRLEAEGLVTRLNNGGVIVADYRPKIGEVFTIRQALECAAVRLACLNGSDAALNAILRNARDGMRNLDSPESRTESDRDFHMAIAEASGSLRLAGLIEEFYFYSFASMQIEPNDEDRRALQVHHLEIASALQQRDQRGAEETMRAHFDEVHRILTMHLGSKMVPAPTEEGDANVHS